MSSRLVRRLLALLASGVLVAAVAPGVAAGKLTFSFTACRSGTDLQMTVSWAGYVADDATFGESTRHPRGGLGVENPFTAASSGTVQVSLGALVDNGNGPQEFDSASAALYLTNGDIPSRKNQLATKTLNRPSTGWPAC